MDERSEIHGERHDEAPNGKTGIPRRLIAGSARLLDLQYRLWRRDLRDPEQPLLEYGFRLVPDDTGIEGRACRYDALDGQATVILADRLLHGRPGGNGVAIDRASLTISAARIHPWMPSAHVVRGTPDVANELVPRLISWIGGYEQWVLDTRGETERSALAQSAGLGSDFPSQWWRLAAEWRAVLARVNLAS